MIDLADRLEPFWDHYLIERLDGAHLHLHEPRAEEVTLRFDRPWEGPMVGYPTLIHEPGRYRLYYRGWPDPNDGAGQSVCVAESTDGIHFQRTPIDKHALHGTQRNNIMLTGGVAHCFAPFRDTNPDAPDSARYKALATNWGDKTRMLYAYASEDGLQWSLIRDEPVLTQGAFDSLNLAFWSAHEGCYVCYFRIFTDKGDAWQRTQGVRTIARATSPDFLQWSEPAEMQFGDTPMEQLYTNGTHPYFRAPHVYVALPKRFVPGRPALSEAEADTFGVHPTQRNAVSEAVFMTSRGGTRYDRPFMEALIRPGLDRQNWVARNRMTTWGIAPTGETEMSLYCQEHYAQPSHHLRRYSLRLDGFASVRAGYFGGEMTTRPFTFNGAQLTMNYSTAAAGSVRVEVQDADGAPLPGLSLDDATTHFGDAIEQPVRWGERADLRAWAGTPIRLRFVMADADVYAIRFR